MVIGFSSLRSGCVLAVWGGGGSSLEKETEMHNDVHSLTDAHGQAESPPSPGQATQARKRGPSLALRIQCCLYPLRPGSCEVRCPRKAQVSLEGGSHVDTKRDTPVTL